MFELAVHLAEGARLEALDREAINARSALTTIINNHKSVKRCSSIRQNVVCDKVKMEMCVVEET